MSYRQASFLLALLSAALAIPFAPAPAAAQQPAVEELDQRELSRKGSTIGRWVGQPSSDPSIRPIYEQYFDRYFFPQMKKSDPAALGELGDMRVELFRDFIQRAAPEIRQDLTQKAYNFATDVIRGRYVRPVKVNAVLILGQLADPSAGGAQQAKPFADATMALCTIVYQSATEQKWPTYLHVAGMVGLERHASQFNQLDTKSKNALAQTLLKAVNQQQFPPGTDPEVKDWLRMQAARAIAAIGIPGPKGIFVHEMQKLITDDAVDLRTRVDVAAMLARLNPTTDAVPAGVAQQTVGALKKLACSVAESERTSAVEFEDLQVQTRRFSNQFYESPRIKRAQDGGWEYQRRGLIAQLEQLRTGIQAGATIAGDQADGLNAIDQALENTVEVAEESDNTSFDVVDSIKAMATEVSQLAGCNEPPPGAEEENAAAGLLGGANSRPAPTAADEPPTDAEAPPADDAEPPADAAGGQDAEN